MTQTVGRPTVRLPRRPSPRSSSRWLAKTTRIVAVCNDSVGSSNLGGFRKEFPDRLINVGIAEQDLVGVGAGLANGGMIPFVSAAAPFLTGRALEQIKADVAYSQAQVVLCGQSPGMAYGELGPDPPLHRGPVLAAGHRRPADRRAGRPRADPRRRPLGRRPPRAELPAHRPVPGARGHRPDDARSKPAAARVLRDGDDVTVIATGTMVSRALEAAETAAPSDGIAASA